LPKEKGNFYVSTLDIDLKGAYREKNEYRFIISAPFLRGDKPDEYLLIKNIKIELRGKSIFEKIKSHFNL